MRVRPRSVCGEPSPASGDLPKREQERPCRCRVSGAHRSAGSIVALPTQTWIGRDAGRSRPPRDESGTIKRRLPIAKASDEHLRLLLVSCSQYINRVRPIGRLDFVKGGISAWHCPWPML